MAEIPSSGASVVDSRSSAEDLEAVRLKHKRCRALLEHRSVVMESFGLLGIGGPAAVLAAEDNYV